MAPICRRLDELPLALELAAARVKAISTAQILERLERSLPLLTGGARDLPERQRTLRATIEWSHELLTPDEQRLFAQLAVFSGGCTLEAVEQVADGELDTLQSLVDKSLVRSNDGRFWMLETIREFALEQLEQSGEAEELRGRHRGFMLQFSEPGELEPAVWTSLLATERENLRAALRWSLDAGQIETSLALAYSYGALCAARGPIGEGRLLLDTALRQPPEQEPPARLKALLSAASLAQRQGDLEPARLLGEESLDLARRIGDRQSAARALRLLGIVAGDHGQYDRSESLQREALALFRESGNEREVRESLAMLGFLATARGDYPGARSTIAEALALSDKAHDARGVHVGLSNLGSLAAQQGLFDEALPLLREGLALTHEALDLYGIAAQLLHLAGSPPSKGNPSMQQSYLEAPRPITKRSNKRWSRSRSRYTRGRCQRSAATSNPTDWPASSARVRR